MPKYSDDSKCGHGNVGVKKFNESHEHAHGESRDPAVRNRVDGVQNELCEIGDTGSSIRDRRKLELEPCKPAQASALQLKVGRGLV